MHPKYRCFLRTLPHFDRVSTHWRSVKLRMFSGLLPQRGHANLSPAGHEQIYPQAGAKTTGSCRGRQRKQKSFQFIFMREFIGVSDFLCLETTIGGKIRAQSGDSFVPLSSREARTTYAKGKYETLFWDRRVSVSLSGPHRFQTWSFSEFFSIEAAFSCHLSSPFIAPGHLMSALQIPETDHRFFHVLNA